MFCEPLKLRQLVSHSIESFFPRPTANSSGSPSPGDDARLPVDAFQDQRPNRSVASRFQRAKASRPHAPSVCLRHRLKGSAFQSLVPNDQAIAREPKHLHAIAAPIEEKEQIARFDLLAQFSFDKADQYVEKLFRLSMPAGRPATTTPAGTKARSAWPCPSCCRGCRESSHHRADRLGVTALNPQHDATRPLDF